MADAEYRIKIEAACPVGFRSICLAGIRDPVLIREIDAVSREVRGKTESFCLREAIAGELFMRFYGRNAVLGEREGVHDDVPREVGVLLEGFGPTQQDADNICAYARTTFLHLGFPGRLSTAGNLAFPFSPSDLPAGEVFDYSLYHLMTLESPSDFPMEIRAGGKRVP